MLVDLEKGDIDLLPAVAVTEERQEIYDYTQDPPFVDSGVLFVGEHFQPATILTCEASVSPG